MSQPFSPQRKYARPPSFGRLMVKALTAGAMVGIAIGCLLALFAGSPADGQPSSAQPPLTQPA
jgi:hypothetical protein